jgi:hypothetical protein
MNLDYAVDRLYETGWHPSNGFDVESLSDGRRYPNVAAIHREFVRRGLRLEIQHKMMFSCYRATWSPASETPDADHVADESHGTVVGSSESEAAVYALAQLRAAIAATAYATAE